MDEEHVNMVQRFGKKRADDTSSKTSYEDTVIADLPKTLRGKGTALVGFFQRNGIGYDSSNRLTYKEKAIPGSNYRDLLSDLVRYRDVAPPKGFETLALILRNVNVGRELITNLERYEYINGLSSEGYAGDSECEVSPVKPRSKKFLGKADPCKRTGGVKKVFEIDRSSPYVIKKWSSF